MTRSIFSLLMIMLFACGTQFAYAQPGRGMEMDLEQQVKGLIAQLDITTEQEPAFREAMIKVNDMRMASMGQMRGMREGQGQNAGAAHDGQGGGGDQASAGAGDAGRGMEMMAQRRAEMEQKTLEILAPVLNAAQLNKYKELEAARMQQMMSRMRR